MKFIGSNIVKWGLAAAMLAVSTVPALAELGEEARKRAAELATEPEPSLLTPQAIESLQSWVTILAGVVLLLILIAINRVASLVEFEPMSQQRTSQIHAWTFLGVGLILAGFIGYEFLHHTKYHIWADSEHGQKIDTLFAITAVITLFVFVVTQVLLFTFAFKYRERAGRKAYYYPDNHKLEYLWTAIPAIALVVLVGGGLVVWEQVHNPDLGGRKPQEIEIVGEQFQWRIRYPGMDGKLGKHGFKLLSATNPHGVDSTDAAAKDDIVASVKEIHVVKNNPVVFKIRAKDVLHGVYAPHFHVNIYAVPGMPTQFHFTPIKSTEEARKERGNDKFNYELLCSQLCGSSHFNMRAVIVVHENEKELIEWMSKQPTFIKSEEPVAQETKTTASL
ncbi:MAG: cytochrome c oxidase subunit II [Bacteroidia bacterium]|nr:cytochrome c oxidase subunit II [Bacteroidia bacterium]MDW8332906.1 cytochrome c oxidase subunit II [Bacteroidia bacterium]